jgi:antimicrobial peptide system SdpB family protein
MYRALEPIIQSIFNSNPWNAKLGLARSLLAMSTLLTLLFNDTNTLFTYGTGISYYPICDGLAKYSIFCLFSDHLEIARYLSILILVITISGYFPRYTCIFSWWVAFSYFNSSVNVDGGDQVNTVISCLLIPICLGDNRRNHWINKQYVYPHSSLSKFKFMWASTAYIVIHIQAAFIYFISATSKLFVPEWLNGTALHYWVNNPLIGPNQPVGILVNFIFKSDLLLFTISWSVLILEILLFTSLFQARKSKVLLYTGIAFHIGTAVLFGIITFCLAMSAVLILFFQAYERAYVHEIRFENVSSSEGYRQ